MIVLYLIGPDFGYDLLESNLPCTYFDKFYALNDLRCQFDSFIFALVDFDKYLTVGTKYKKYN